jgi:hypothetical protein
MKVNYSADIQTVNNARSSVINKHVLEHTTMQLEKGLEKPKTKATVEHLTSAA